jgi:gliding motility-associated-like protein
LTVTLNGCTASGSINVSLGTNGSINIGPDTVLCIGESVILTVDNANAVWSNNVHGKSIRVYYPGKYWVTVYDGCGNISDTINVDFHICDIGFPSAFTPNGDGKNDDIGVEGTLKYYQNFAMSFFNRWGERVFYTEDIYGRWDGIYNGVKQDLGTYFYMIFYSFEGHKHMMKGDFQLIR